MVFVFDFGIRILYFNVSRYNPFPFPFLNGSISNFKVQPGTNFETENVNQYMCSAEKFDDRS